MTAQTFKYAIERSLSPRMKGPAIGQGYLSSVVGAEEYSAGKARHIRGIVASGDTLTVRLVRPDHAVAHMFALPFFCAVPIDTPLDPKGPGASLQLDRITSLPTPPAKVSSCGETRITVEVAPTGQRGRCSSSGNTIEKATALVEAGEADYQVQGVASQSASRVASRYGPESAAAKQRRQRFFTNPSLGFSFFILNQRRPLFR